MVRQTSYVIDADSTAVDLVAYKLMRQSWFYKWPFSLPAIYVFVRNLYLLIYQMLDSLFCWFNNEQGASLTE